MSPDEQQKPQPEELTSLNADDLDIEDLEQASGGTSSDSVVRPGICEIFDCGTYSG